MKKIFGVFLCFCIALPAWYLGRIFPLFGGPIAAIFAGIILSFFLPNLLKHQLIKGFSFDEGVKYTSKKLLQYSIVLLGFGMNLFNILEVGGMSLIVMAFAFVTVFIVAFCLGRMLKLSGDTTTLIGVGTSICGGSAIAAIAPVIRAKDDDVTRAISTIFLFNVIAVLVFPALGHAAGMNDTIFGIWAGAAINDTSSVVAAGTIWSVAAGDNTALNVATIVKLTRTLMIIPIALFLALYTANKLKDKEAGKLNFAKIFPWFILFFVAAAIVNTFLGLPAGISSFLVQIGKFVIIMAMAGIGLNTNLRSLFSSGIKPVFLGFICWAAIALVSIAVLTFAPWQLG